jgi:hypothetical protein
VTDPGGAHDLYFVADGAAGGLFVRSLRFPAAANVTAAVTPAPGAAGWYTADATVAVSASPLWTRQVSVDGGPWVDAPVTLSADGVHAVGYRAVDAAGVEAPGGSMTVRVDRTAPSVVVPAGPRGHASVLDVPVTDPVSGVAATTMTLDGTPVTAPLELWHHPAGTHELSVSATDAAGNTTTSTTTLTIATSLPELTPLLTRFPVPFLKSLFMRLQLMAAQRALARGLVEEAVIWLTLFRHSATKLRDPEARTTLTTDADLVLASVTAR